MRVVPQSDFVSKRSVARRAHVVQLGFESISVGQPEVAAYSIKLQSECFHPPGLVNGDSALGNFPCVANVLVQARLILETMSGRPGDCAQAAGRARRDGETDPAHALDFEVKISARDGQARSE